jgi:hypothetical protein
MRSQLIEGTESTMADITSVDLARLAGENLEQASPDLLRAMVKAFAEALMGAGGRRGLRGTLRAAL